MSPAPKSLEQLRHYKTGYSSDRYWRMPIYVITGQVADIRQLLKAHGYPHTGPASDFQYMLQSIARSLPGYEKCKIAELRQFAQQRVLMDAKKADKADRKQLVETLRLADETPRFDQFFALPPELRVSIYRLYCADFADEPLTIPTYPPLARVNKHLRAEMLPIFYSECTFAVGLTIDSHFNGRAIPHVLHMQRDTTLFFKSLSPESLAHVQKLEVTFESRHPGLSVEMFRLRIVVPRCGKPGTAQVIVRKLFQDYVDVGILHPWNIGERVGSEQLRGLEERVASFVAKIQQRGQSKNDLMIADVYRLRTMLEDFFEKH